MPSEPTPLGANPTWADYMNVLSHRVYPKDTMVDHHLLHRNCQCGLLQTFRQTHYHYPSSLVISVISVISMLYSQIFPIYPHINWRISTSICWSYPQPCLPLPKQSKSRAGLRSRVITRARGGEESEKLAVGETGKNVRTVTVQT